MTTLVANIPPVKVWVRKEYLYDLQWGHGEYTPGYWVTCKSLTGRALQFETYLTEYGALFDKLPISAFLSWDPDYPDKPKEPTPDLALTDLQFWNGFDHGLTVVEKNLVFNMRFEILTRSAGVVGGTYLFTIDNYHAHRNEPDFYFAEVPDEHKSHNIVALDNGQIGAYPNNRCRMVDPSLTNHNLKTPDFKVSTRYFECEGSLKWGRLGECDDYFWKTPTEKVADEETQSKEKTIDSVSVRKVSHETTSDFMDENFYRDNLAGFAGNGEKQEADQRLVEQKNKDQASTKIRFDFDR
jgi:hypothetical protein